ncbi:MAG: hypothetical protein BHV68_23185, partial [Bacteroidales bacterium 43_8]
SGLLMSVQGVMNTGVTKQTSLWVSAGFFPFCAFIFLCILHEINYHWYYLIPFYIGWIGVNKICEKKFLLNGYYKHIIKEKPVFSDNQKLNAIITILYTFIMTFGSSYLIVLAKHLK